MNGSEKWRKWLQLWRKKHFIKINFYFLFSIVCNVWFVSLSFTFHFQHDFSFARITCWEGHKFSKEATLRWITSERKGDCRISYTHKWKSVPRHSHQRWKMKFNSIEKIFRKISNEKSFEEKKIHEYETFLASLNIHPSQFQSVSKWNLTIVNLFILCFVNNENIFILVKIFCHERLSMKRYFGSWQIEAIETKEIQFCRVPRILHSIYLDRNEQKQTQILMKFTIFKRKITAFIYVRTVCICMCEWL